MPIIAIQISEIRDHEGRSLHGGTYSLNWGAVVVRPEEARKAAEAAKAEAPAVTPEVEAEDLIRAEISRRARRI